MMLRTIVTGLVASAATVLVGFGATATSVPANAVSAPRFPDNNASRGQCDNLAWQIANLNARADRSDDSHKANRLRNQAENVEKLAINIGCTL